jgi:hypothetical protein
VAERVVTHGVRISIRLDGRGMGAVVVDGVDISDRVRGIEIGARPNVSPLVKISLVPDEIEIDAESTVITDTAVHYGPRA